MEESRTRLVHIHILDLWRKKKKKKGTAEQWGMDGFLDKCYLIN